MGSEPPFAPFPPVCWLRVETTSFCFCLGGLRSGDFVGGFRMDCSVVCQLGGWKSRFWVSAVALGD